MNKIIMWAIIVIGIYGVWLIVSAIINAIESVKRWQGNVLYWLEGKYSNVNLRNENWKLGVENRNLKQRNDELEKRWVLVKKGKMS